MFYIIGDGLWTQMVVRTQFYIVFCSDIFLLDRAGVRVRNRKKGGVFEGVWFIEKSLTIT